MRGKFILAVAVLIIFISIISLSLVASAPNVTAPQNKTRIKESFKNNTFITFPSAISCSSFWGGDCSEGPPESFKNTLDECDTGFGEDESINEMWLNQTQYLLGSEVEVTCNVMIWQIMAMAINNTEMNDSGCEYGWLQDRMGIYYRNSSTSLWVRKNYSSQVYSCFNYSARFPLDLVEGEHQIRCVTGHRIPPNDACASGNFYDHDDISFSVLPPYISITLDNAPIDFGDNANPGSLDYNAINNPLTIRVDSNIRFNITTKADSADFISGSNPLDTFPVSKMKWRTSPSNPLTSYTTSEQLVYSNEVAGNFPLYHTISIPPAQPEGAYSADITITALQA